MSCGQFLFLLLIQGIVTLKKKMRREPDSYRMGNIFGQPAREKAFMATARRTASNVRNAFRQEVHFFYSRTCLYNALIPLPSPASGQCYGSKSNLIDYLHCADGNEISSRLSNLATGSRIQDPQRSACKCSY